MSRIYLDHAATTPLLPEARAAMMPWLDAGFGNPSSLHTEGRLAKQALDVARESFANALGCLFSEITFCSSATEAANMALLGLAAANPNRKKVIVTAAEHQCVLTCIKPLERMGCKVIVLPVKANSTLCMKRLTEVLDDQVLAVAVMHTNNETGAVNPVSKVVELAQLHGVFTICDAVQAPINDWKTGANITFVAPHKFGGPKGCGVLATRYPATFEPLIYGGGQERELRGGTENVAAIAGSFAALETYSKKEESFRENEFKCAQSFLAELGSCVLPSVSAAKQSHPGILNLRFPGVNAESLLIRLDRAGVSASMGAACSAGSQEPSHVLLACGLDESVALECVRFSFGWTSTVEEALKAAQIIKRSL